MTLEIKYGYNDRTVRGAGRVHIKRPNEPLVALCGYKPIHVPASSQDTPKCQRCQKHQNKHHVYPTHAEQLRDPSHRCFMLGCFALEEVSP